MKKIKKKRLKIIFALIGVLIFVITSHSGAAAADTRKIQGRDAENFGTLEMTIFWKGEEQLAGFRNFDKLYDTRKIERGDLVYPLLTEFQDFSNFKYEFEGKTYSFDDYIANHRVTGLLIIKNNRIVAESYSLGNTATSRWVSYSVSKAVTSMLVGVAIQDGYIKSVDDKVSDYVRHLKGTSYDDVSIRNLMQMASGVEWNEDYADPKSDLNMMPRASMLEMIKFISTKKRVAKAGEKFNYNTAETNLVGAVVRSAIGNNLATYLTDKIWIPFGMESDATWLLHGPGGGEWGGCCINATLRDYGRIGLFAMNDGKLADGTRVLPENWMKDSTQPSKAYPGYGYFWWLKENGAYSAEGIFGQLIYINPSENLIIATQSAWPVAWDDKHPAQRDAFLNAVNDFLR